MRLLTLLVISAALFGASDSVAARAHPPRYRMTGLGATASFCRLNNLGQVAGTVDTGRDEDLDGLTEIHAGLWEHGQWRDLGTLPGPPGSESAAYDLNDRGQVVGSSDTGNSLEENVQRGFLWENGRMQDLGSLDSEGESDAFGINELGQVIGDASGVLKGEYYLKAFLWQQGRMTPLDPAPSRLSDGYALNNRGVALGYVEMPTRAVLWSKGRRRAIRVSTDPVPAISDINDRSEVVGTACVPDGSYDGLGSGRPRLLPTGPARRQGAVPLDGAGPSAGFVWKDGRARLLPTPRRWRYVGADAVNNRGLIVGSESSTNPPHALLWQGGRVWDLNSLTELPSGVKLGLTYDINDLGQIVGGGFRGEDEFVYLLTPL